MAEQNRGDRGGRRGRGGRGRGVVPEADEQPRHRDPRDVEIEEQRRRIQDLERQLAQVGLGVQSEEEESDATSYDEEEDVNPFGVRNQGRNRGMRPGHRSPFRNIGMKIEIPEFEGKTPDEFIDWLHTVERVFDIKDLTEEQKVKLVAIKLRKHASIWWEHVKKQRAREGKSKVKRWDKMKKLL